MVAAMMRPGLVVVLAVAGCGGDATHGTPPDGGTPCLTVCWAPAARQVTSTTPPPITDITVTDCNILGLAPKTCPTGFACTGSETLPYTADHTYTRALCEPSRTPIAPLVFDLPATAQPQGAVRVEVDLTLNGGAWPTSPTPGSAGVISLTPRRGGAAIVQNLPTDASTLALDLAPGDYDTFVAVGSPLDASRYPPVTISGVLTVVAAGSVHLDFAGQPVTYALRLDGAGFPPLGSQDSMTLTLRGGHGQLVILPRNGPATAPSGVLVLEPDSYRVTLDTSSFASPPTFPMGTAVLADPLVVTAAQTRTFDVTTFPIAGAVRIDGADLPADVRATLRFGANSFAATGAPARYQGRIYAGSYDVVLDTSASRSPAVPSGTIRVVPGFTAGPSTLDAVATTTTFTGAVTLNGATPPAASLRGALALAAPGASQFVSLPTAGPATWDTRIYTGTYAVSLTASRVFPNEDVVLEPGLVATAPVARSYNVDAGTVNLVVLDEASQPVDATTSRGTFHLRRAGSPQVAAGFAPSTGPVATSLVVEPGTWSVSFTTGSSYAGLPIGTAALGDVTVTAGSTTAMTFSAHATTLSGEVRRDGQPLPPAQPGTSRGAIDLANIGATVDLPASGPATFSFRVFPGVYDLGLQCASNCSTTPAAFVYLASGLRYR